MADAESSATRTDAGADAGRQPFPRVVIVGAGFGGLSAAKALASAPVHVTVVDRRNHHLFQPLLYQVATAALSPADIAVPIRAILRAGRNPRLDVLLDEVVGLDLDGRQVHTGGGARLPYDFLILATGSEYSYFGHDDWAKHAPGLKSLNDATSIRDRMLLAFERAEAAEDPALRQGLMTFVVIGGGPTGVKTAGAIAELAKATLAQDFSRIDPRGARVLLVEAGERLLASFSEEQSRFSAEALARLGVEVALRTAVEAVEEDGVRIAGEKILAETVIWCAGVKATPVGQWTGLPTARNGTLEVLPGLSVPDHPEVFIIGDAARLAGPDGKPLPGLAPVAKQQGAHAAEVIERRVTGRPPPAPFRYRDWGSMTTIGRSAAVGKFGRLEVSGFFAWLLWGIAHIGYLVEFRNRIVVLVNWLWSWAIYGKGARLIAAPVPGRSGRAVAAGSAAPFQTAAHADSRGTSPRDLGQRGKEEGACHER